MPSRVWNELICANCGAESGPRLGSLALVADELGRAGWGKERSATGMRDHLCPTCYRATRRRRVLAEAEAREEARQSVRSVNWWTPQPGGGEHV